MEANEKRILIFTNIAHYYCHFFVLVFPALVMPISRDFNISLKHTISIAFPMYLCYGILATLWGFFSDQLGPRWIMATGIIVSGIGFITAGFATTVFGLTVGFAIVGVGCSAYHPSGLALLTKGIRIRGRALGINGLFGNAGIASAPLLAGILSYSIGWQQALFFLGALGIVSGVLTIFVPFSVGRTEELQKGQDFDKSQSVKLFIIMCVAMLLSGIMYRGYTVLLPAFFETRLAQEFARIIKILPSVFDLDQLSSDKNTLKTLIANIITSIVYVIGMAGQLVAGKMADRRELRVSYLLYFVMALPFLVSMIYLNKFMLVLAAGLFAFFSIGVQPIENSLIAMLTPAKWRSVTYGVKFTLVFGAGALAIPIVGYVEAGYGLNNVFLLLTFILVLIILSILLLIFTSRDQQIRHKH